MSQGRKRGCCEINSFLNLNFFATKGCLSCFEKFRCKRFSELFCVNLRLDWRGFFSSLLIRSRLSLILSKKFLSFADTKSTQFDFELKSENSMDIHELNLMKENRKIELKSLTRIFVFSARFFGSIYLVKSRTLKESWKCLTRNFRRRRITEFENSKVIEWI